MFKDIFSRYAQEGIVSTKADIVAYGAGGLIAEKFLSDLQKDIGSYKQPAARRIITIATPHHGTPYADIWLNSAETLLKNLDNMTYDLTTKLLIKTLIIANRHFITNNNGMFVELATTAEHDYIFPSGVPLFCIYGNVTDELRTELIAELVDRIIAMKTNGAHHFNFKDLPGTALTYALQYSPIIIKKYAPRIGLRLVKSLALKCVPFIGLVSTAKDIKDLADLSIKLTSGIMFNSQKHDMYVSASSATGGFRTSCIGFDGMEYEHFKICEQPDIGNEVAFILKGLSWKNSTYSYESVSTNNNTYLNTSSVHSSSTDDTDEFEFIETLRLNVQPAIFTLKDSESRTVKFTVTTDNFTEDDIYCFIDDGDDGKIFLIPASDNTGKNFYAEVTFDYQDLGTRSIFCFSHNPDDSEGKSIYVSNATQVTAVSDMNDINVARLEFVDNAELSVYINVETPAGLYAIDNNENYYDISSPLAGTKWASNEYAQVNENGCIYGLKEGNTTLTATFRGFSVSIDVDVLPAVENVNEDFICIINEETFPNKNFRDYISQACDTNGDGRLSTEEISSVTVIDVNNMDISSLAGIENFPNLRKLYSSNNNLTILDLTNNPLLEALFCNDNQLTYIDVSNCENLRTLDCARNNLTTLDVSNCPLLQKLAFRNNNITNIDVTQNTSLIELNCPYNDLHEIDLSKNLNLEILDCGSNDISVLDVSHNLSLKELWCFSNRISDIDVSKNLELTYLDCGGNNLITIDFSNNLKLTTLECYRNQITALDVSMNTLLEYLDCGPNKLTRLDVSNNKALKYLDCYNNLLTELILGNNSALTTLDCGDNPSLRTLDISGCPNLPSDFLHDDALTIITDENKGSTNVISKNVPLENGDELQVDISTVPVQEANIDEEEIRNILGDMWSDATIRSLITDMYQIDNRTETEKVAIIKELIREQDVKINYAYILYPMKPTESGIFAFVLSLPNAINTGDTLVWSCKSTVNPSYLSTSTTDTNEAVFIDMTTKEKTKTVPAARLVSVLAQLNKDQTYEPVIFTTSSDIDAPRRDTPEPKTDEDTHSESSSSGGGCSLGTHAFLMIFSLMLLLLGKKNRLH